MIAQLGIAAAEFAAGQAAAVATFGVAEMLGHLLDKVLGPAVEEIERTVAKLSYQEASGVLLGPEGTGGTKANTEPMRAHSAAIHREAEGVSSGGAQLVSKLAELSFTSGG